ncbi:MAG TPA: hypothetical protein VFP95_02455 [Gammaproteobacteria bacterium]|nr:hypothetical protein [Gammaproteobacteria bacterium]
MKALTLDDFSKGIDRTRNRSVSSPEQLYDLVNGYVTPGKSIVRRPGFTRHKVVTGAKGLLAADGQLHVFYSGADPGSDSLVTTHKLIDPSGNGASLSKVHFAQTLLAKIYVVAEFSDGKTWHFYLSDAANWQAGSIYATGDIVSPTTKNGLQYKVTSEYSYADWQPNKQYVINDLIVPTNENGRRYRVTSVVGNGLSGEVEPDWPLNEGDTVLDEHEVPPPPPPPLDPDLPPWKDPEWRRRHDPNPIQAPRPTRAPVMWSPGMPVEPGEIIIPRQNNKRGLAFKVKPSTTSSLRIIRTGPNEPDWPFPDPVPDPDTPPAPPTEPDGDVEYETVVTNQITWTCEYINGSGTTEPIWPTTPGQTVFDSGITWTALSYQVTDDNCPHTPIVAIAANKVYAADGDVVRFSATSNPGDWSADEDAGFLPTNLQSVGEADVSAMGVYRGNLAVWTANAVQIWQVDPDPRQNTFLDAFDGAGSRFTRAATPLTGDLFYLCGQGVRSLRSVYQTGQTEASDVGSPIDALVKNLITDTFTPVGVYWPGQGQYWCAIGNQVFVFAYYPSSRVTAWSRYTLPWAVEYAATLGDVMYVLADDGGLYYQDETRHSDDDGATPVTYTLSVDWPYLDMGAPGMNKQLTGIDVVASQAVKFQAAYDQSAVGNKTTLIEIGPDNRPGGIVPVGVLSTSIAPHIEHTVDEAAELFTLAVYYQTLGLTA